MSAGGSASSQLEPIRESRIDSDIANLGSQRRLEAVGAPDRPLRYVARGEPEAKKLMQHSLQRRATARERIGVSYRFRELIDPWQWLPLTADGLAAGAGRP